MIEITLHDVSINYGFKKILDGVSFNIQTGEKVALVGRNGSGKTTILKIITGLETCDSGQCTIRRGATLGYLEQIADESSSGLTVLDVLKEAHQHFFAVESEMREMESQLSTAEDTVLERLMNAYGRLQNKFIAMEGHETGEAFDRICNAFHIGEAMLRQKFSELSGGQKTMVKLAQTLLKKPDILLLDEPTNHIDIDTLQWLESFIADYKGTVVIVSHDRYFIDKTAGRTILIEHGQSEVFNGNYSFCLKEQERLLMREFEDYKDQQKKIKAMREAIRRFREWAKIGDNKMLFRKAANMEKRLEKIEMLERPQSERNKLPLQFNMESRSGKIVASLKAFSFSFGAQPLFQNANLDITFKEKICVMGKNGSGKSTLVHVLMDELNGYGGAVHRGSSVKIGYVEQEINFPNENETILELFKREIQLLELDARRILAKFYFIGDDALKRVGSLSGGEKVILKLALILQNNINFLILDEPTNHLDIDTKELLEESLSEYKGTLLFISHDRYFINKVAERIVEIDEQQLKSYNGNYDYYLEKR